MQELCEICNGDECEETTACQEEEPEDAQVCLAISMSASPVVASMHSIQFQGTVQGLPARILLVSSGSSHTFISADLAAKLSGVSSFSPALSVTVADGFVLYCSSQFKQLEWSVQDYEFVSVAKVLPLTAYELILGMHWLSTHSPMQIDWRHKWLLITRDDSQKML